MLIIAVLAGVAYVYFSGKTPAKPASADKPADIYPAIKPKVPSPSAPASAAIESLLTPVSLGSNTSVSVKTVPTAKCTISVTYNEVPSKDSGLSPKTADVYGNVVWSWTVEKTAPLGTWPVKVTCVYNKKSAVVIGNLQVVK